jgi:DNA invertase Pin-like site-specific DNA recombinase
MNVCIYTRVSTTDQTVEPQLIELRAYAKSREWQIVREYTDVISGAKSSREGMDAMMADVRAHQFDAILAVKIDRIARSLVHFTQIVDELKKHGVALVVPGAGIDTSHSNPAGELQMNVLASVAQFERELIRERTRAGLAAARARGKKLGHPSTKLLPNHQEIVAAWKQEGGRHLRDLACRLGGVSVSFAHTLSKRDA